MVTFPVLEGAGLDTSQGGEVGEIPPGIHVTPPVGATPPCPVTVAVKTTTAPTFPLPPLPANTMFPDGEALPTVTLAALVSGSAP